MKAKLDSQHGSWALEHYRQPSGEYISSTLGAQAERVQAGHQSTPRKDTCSYLYHVYKGSGETEIVTSKGETKNIRWEAQDTFAVPSWSRITHKADSGQDAYLFSVSDRPLLDSLGMYFVASN